MRLHEDCEELRTPPVVELHTTYSKQKGKYIYNSSIRSYSNTEHRIQAINPGILTVFHFDYGVSERRYK